MYHHHLRPSLVSFFFIAHCCPHRTALTPPPRTPISSSSAAATSPTYTGRHLLPRPSDAPMRLSTRYSLACFTSNRLGSTVTATLLSITINPFFSFELLHSSNSIRKSSKTVCHQNQIFCTLNVKQQALPYIAT